MPMWIFILIGTAFGGALIVWHNVSKTKHLSEEMLVKYRTMLAEAREKKAEELAQQAADAAKEEAKG